MSSISERLRGAAAGDVGRTVGVAILVTVLAAGLQLARVWDNLDGLLFDLFTVSAPPRRAAPAPVVVVGIDEPSFSELGLQWPWPRELHARLIDELTRAGASVIAFDVLFSEPSNEKADSALARAIGASGRVVLAGDVVPQETAHFRGLQRVEPLAAFREAGAVTGIASIEVARDQVVRQFPQDPEAFWRVTIERHLVSEGKPGYPASAPGPRARVRYTDASDLGYVSYYQALDAAKLLPEGIFKGKVALVGLVLKTSPDPRRRSDTYATPFLRFSQMFAPGVELQGQFVASAYAGRAIRSIPWAWTGAVCALTLLLAIAFLARWSALRSTLFALVAALALLGVSYLLFEHGDLWLPVSLPLGLLLGLYLGRGTTAYLDELRRKQEIRRAFEFYVAPTVVSQMTSHPERLVLGGERKELTVMFTDLAGFTSMSEDIAPEAVAQILNEHLTRMTGIVLRHGGTIDKFIGDSVMAFWGAPLDDPGHALHAVRAAIDMQAEMQRWRQEPGGPGELHMRVGINTGPMVVGNLGSKSRFDYTVIGDAVNLASRLESANRMYGSEILLTEAVARSLGESIPLRHVDRIRVKGKRDAIEIYTPEKEAGIGAMAADAIQAYRAREWDRAQALWHDVLARLPGDAVASLYLARIERHRRDGVPPDWDGTLDLDQK